MLVWNKRSKKGPKVDLGLWRGAPVGKGEVKNIAQAS